MNRLVIGIVVWNNVSDAVECADSLLKQTTDDFTILFINNGSTETSVSAELKTYIKNNTSKQLKYTDSTTNDGTAGGFNALVAWAKKHKYLYAGSLNADAVADKKWVESLLKELDDSGCAIATGQVLHQSDHTIDSTGDFYTAWGLPGPRGRDMAAREASMDSEEIFGATGGAFIARVELFDSIGGYDEKFFMYYEDVDVSFRAQLAGMKVRYTPKAIAYHKRGASSDTVPGLATYNTFKNLPILFWKNVPLGLLPKIAPRFFLAYHLIFFNAIAKGKAVPAIKGYVASLLLLPHSLRERRRIQGSKKVSSDYIRTVILHDIPPDQTGLRKFRKFFTGQA